jgi:UDP-glucose 4-epimerase
MNTKRILVSGGAGFIGSNLVNRLIKMGHKVVVVDNLFLGKMENIHQEDGNVDIIPGDVKNINSMELGKFDLIYHFGNPSSAPMFESDMKALMNTIDGFIAMSSKSQQDGSRLVYASTSSIYGPETTYSFARMTMESIAEKMELNAVGMRFFSVYGPNENHKGKFANCLTQFLWGMGRGEAPTIYGDGTQSRDFIHVDDVVDALILAGDSDFKGYLDIGTGRETSFNEIVSMLNKELGKTINPIYVKNPITKYVEHTKATEAQLKRTEDAIGFRAKISLEDGIKRQVKEYV